VGEEPPLQGSELYPNLSRPSIALSGLPQPGLDKDASSMLSKAIAFKDPYKKNPVLSIKDASLSSPG